MNSCWWYGGKLAAPAHSAGFPGAWCPGQLLPLVPSHHDHGDQLPAVILYALSILGSMAIRCPNTCTSMSGDCTSMPQKRLSELSRCSVSLGVPTGLCSPSPDTFMLKVLHRLQQHINLPFHIPAPKAQVLCGLILPFQMTSLLRTKWWTRWKLPRAETLLLGAASCGGAGRDATGWLRSPASEGAVSHWELTLAFPRRFYLPGSLTLPVCCFESQATEPRKNWPFL